MSNQKALNRKRGEKSDTR